MNRPRSGTKSSSLTTTNAFIWTFLGIIFLLQFNRDLHTSFFIEAMWIIAGIVVGVFLGVLFTRGTLNNLQKNGESKKTLKTLLIQIGGAVLAVVILAEVFFSNTFEVWKSGLAYSLITCCLSALDIRAALMVHWERKNKATIYQDNYGLFIVPKQPATQIDNRTSAQAIRGEEESRIN